MTNIKNEDWTTTRTGHRIHTVQCAPEEKRFSSQHFMIYIFRIFFLFFVYFFRFILREYLIFMSAAYFAFCIIHIWHTHISMHDLFRLTSSFSLSSFRFVASFALSPPFRSTHFPLLVSHGDNRNTMELSHTQYSTNTLWPITGPKCIDRFVVIGRLELKMIRCYDGAAFRV